MKKLNSISKTQVIKICIVIVLTLTCIFGVYSLSKYIGNEKSNHLLETKDFYFSSDYLDINNPSHNVYNNSTFTINLYNYDKNNKALITENDIVYNTLIKYYDSNNVQIGSDVTTTNNNTWITNNNLKYVTLSINYMSNTKYVIVEVTSISPYTKILSARFSYCADTATVYTFTDEGNYCLFKVVTGSMNTSVSLSWDIAMYAPDDTNSNIVGYITDGTTQNKNVVLLPNRVYEFIFFENTAEIHSTLNGTLSSIFVLPID